MVTDGLWAPNGARGWLMDFLFPLVVIPWFNHETLFWGEFWNWPASAKRPVFYVPIFTVSVVSSQDYYRFFLSFFPSFSLSVYMYCAIMI